MSDKQYPPLPEPVAKVFSMFPVVPGGAEKLHVTLLKQVPAGTKLYAAPQPNAAADGWVSVDERSPKLYERVMVITTDCDDEPYATPAHYNGPGKFLGAGGVRLEPVTHWQQIDAPPVGWKLPPANPRVRHRRKPAPPTLNAIKEGSHADQA